MFTAQLFSHFRFANMTRRKLAQKQEAKQTGLVSNTLAYTSGVWIFFFFYLCSNAQNGQMQYTSCLTVDLEETDKRARGLASAGSECGPVV